MDESVASALNAAKVDATKPDYPEGYLGGAYLAGPQRAPTPVVPLASNAPPMPVVSTNDELDAAVVLLLDRDAKSNAEKEGVAGLLNSIQPLLQTSRTKPAASSVVSFAKLLRTAPPSVEGAGREGPHTPSEPANTNGVKHEEGTVFSVKLGDNDTALSCTDGVVKVTTKIEGLCVQVELSPPLARSVYNVLTFNGEVAATPVALKERSTLIVADGVTEDIAAAALPTAAPVVAEKPVSNFKRPVLAAPSRASGSTPLDPLSDELQTSQPKVDDQSEFCPSGRTSTPSAPPVQDAPETSDTRALRSPSPAEVQEPREEYGSTALAPLPPGPPPRHTGWSPSDGSGSELEARRRKSARRRAKRRPASLPRKGRKKKSTQARR